MTARRRADGRLPLPGRLVRQARDDGPADGESVTSMRLRHDHKHDLAFRPLETALVKGASTPSTSKLGSFALFQRATGKFKAIEDLARYPDWTLQGANIPATMTGHGCGLAEEHPELVVAFLKGMIKVGRWANEHKRTAARFSTSRRSTATSRLPMRASGPSTWCRCCRPQPGLRRDRQGLVRSHGYIDTTSMSMSGLRGVPRAGCEGTCRAGVEEGDDGQSSRMRPSC